MEKQLFHQLQVPNSFLDINGLRERPREPRIQWLDTSIARLDVDEWDHWIHPQLLDFDKGLAWLLTLGKRHDPISAKDFPLPPADEETVLSLTMAIFGEESVTYKGQILPDWKNEFLGRLEEKGYSPSEIKAINLFTNEDDLEEYPHVKDILKKRFQSNVWLGDVFLQLKSLPTLIFKNGNHKSCVCYLAEEDLRHLAD